MKKCDKGIYILTISMQATYSRIWKNIHKAVLLIQLQQKIRNKTTAYQKRLTGKISYKINDGKYYAAVLKEYGRSIGIHKVFFYRLDVPLTSFALIFICLCFQTLQTSIIIMC